MVAEVKRRKKDTIDGELALATATDGNHGYGVAWISKQLNIKSFIYMPQVNCYLMDKRGSNLCIKSSYFWKRKVLHFDREQ